MATRWETGTRALIMFTPAERSRVEWAESGEETIERRREGLIPETPVRSIE